MWIVRKQTIHMSGKDLLSMKNKNQNVVCFKLTIFDCFISCKDVFISCKDVLKGRANDSM